MFYNIGFLYYISYDNLVKIPNLIFDNCNFNLPIKEISINNNERFFKNLDKFAINELFYNRKKYLK